MVQSVDARDALAVAAAFGLRPGDVAVAVFAHPDDEAWSAAGTLMALNAAGVRSHVVFATDGEAGHDDLRRGWTPAQLGQERRREAFAAAAVLGCEQPVFLGFPDGGLASLEADAGETSGAALRLALTEQLALLRPQAVFSLGLDGGYPHRDHVALAAACLAVCQAPAIVAADEPTSHPLFFAAFAPGTFAPLLRLLRRARAETILDPSWPAERLGQAPLSASTVSIAIDALRDRKCAAIAAHRSQLRNGDPLALLGPGVVASLLGREDWICALGGKAVGAERRKDGKVENRKTEGRQDESGNGEGRKSDDDD